MELCTSMNVKYLLFILLGVSCYRGRVVDGQVMGSFKCTPKSPSISPADRHDTDSSPSDTISTSTDTISTSTDTTSSLIETTSTSGAIIPASTDISSSVDTDSSPSDTISTSTDTTSFLIETTSTSGAIIPASTDISSSDDTDSSPSDTISTSTDTHSTSTDTTSSLIETTSTLGAIIPTSTDISSSDDTDSSSIDTSSINISSSYNDEFHTTTIPVCDDGMVKCYNGSRLGCAMLGKCVCNLTTADTIISSGGFYVNDDCNRRAHCIHGNVTWDDEYFCSSNAKCEDRDNVRQCYCKTGYHGDGKTCTRHTNCQDAYNAGKRDGGIYNIKPTNWPGSPFPVYCNMTDGGGWTVFQRRVDGSVDFYRNWKSYKEGFGELDHEFWLGNDKLYYLTNQGRYTLRIDLVDRNGSSYFAKYDLFRINDGNDKYRLSKLGAFNGTAKTSSNGKDALRHHMNQAFSTHDRDNDGFGNKDCARLRHGGWWYHKCCTANLNSDYNVDLITPDSTKCCGLVTSVCWRDLPGPDHNLKYTEMKIRPV